MMIRPDRLPDMPAPIQAPERIFVTHSKKIILHRCSKAPSHLLYKVAAAAGGLVQAYGAGAFKP